MMYSAVAYFFLLKIVFFFGLVRAQVRYDAIKDHWLFLGLLYTSGVAFLSFVFLVSWQQLAWAPWQIRVAGTIGVSPWMAWLGETSLIATLYFRLMARFDEGVIFWTLLLLGVPLVFF